VGQIKVEWGLESSFSGPAILAIGETTITSILTEVILVQLPTSIETVKFVNIIYQEVTRLWIQDDSRFAFQLAIRAYVLRC
jgi:hypothetical protein